MTEAVAEESPFNRIGGVEPIRAMVDRFYDLMDQDPAYRRLRAIHAEDLTPMRESLTGFLTGWMGGPRDWFASGKCVMGAHAPFTIDAGLRDEWLDAIHRAMVDSRIDQAMIDMLDTAFSRVAGAMTRG
jgi:hemoglobin